MILYEKEVNLSEEDKLRIQLMKTIAIARGYTREELVSQTQQFDFRKDSNFYTLAQSLMENFEIKARKIDRVEDIISAKPTIADKIQESIKREKEKDEVSINEVKEEKEDAM